MKSDEILQEIVVSGHATGPDISKWNVNYDLDEAPADVEAALEATDFIDARGMVTYQSGWIDIYPKLEQNYQEMEQHPDKVRIIYGFLNKSRKWTDQYEKFTEAIDGKDFEIHEADAEHHGLYNNIMNSPADANRFAGITYNFLRQLEKDFPHKIPMLYTNYPTYVIMRQYYPDLDRFPLHYARFPYDYWYNLSANWEPSFRAWIKDVFSGVKQPILPPTRLPSQWEIWQLGDKTGLGYELGVSGSDNIDINISRRLLEDFREWAGLYKRWQPEGPTEPPVELTLEEKVALLWQAHPELHP